MDNTTIVAKIEGYKLIARTAIREGLINARLTRLATAESSLEAYKEIIKGLEKQKTVIAYDLSKLDTDHPLFEDREKAAKESLENLEALIVDANKDLVAYVEAVDEQKEGIAKIESGETKVSIDALNSLVSRMIEKSALDQA